MTEVDPEADETKAEEAKPETEEPAEVETAAASEPKPPWRERVEGYYLSFFARQTDGVAAGIFRLSLGALALWESLAIWLNLKRFFAHDGMIPWEIVEKDKYIWLTPFNWWPKSYPVLYGQAVVMTVASIALFAGFRARFAALVVAYVHASFQFRNPFILNSGDRLFMIMCFLGAFAPLSMRFGIDAWLRERKKLPLPYATVWGQRLVVLQLSYVYLNSAVAKLGNTRWRTGIALRDVLSSPVFAEWPAYVDFKPIIWTMTYSTLALELSFPVLVWFKRYRPYILLWGVAFHTGIDLLMVIPIFSAIMIASYPAALDDAEANWLLSRLSRLLRRGAPAVAAPAPSPSDVTATEPVPAAQKKKKKKRKVRPAAEPT